MQHLQESMQGHLKLHFEHEEATEEQVLAAFPTALRRRILRHLYLEPLRAVYLFRGTRQKFLDALISVGRLELFMPAVSPSHTPPPPPPRGGHNLHALMLCEPWRGDRPQLKPSQLCPLPI